MDKATLDLTKIFRHCSGYQMTLLFHQLVHVSLVSCVVAVFITAILWSVASHQWLSIWIGLVFFLALFRIFLIYVFQEKFYSGREDIPFWPWQVLTLGSIFLSAFVWGSLAFLYDFAWPAMQQFAVFAILIIVALGAITAYATISFVYISYLALILGPLSLVFIFSKIDPFLFYGFGLILLALVIYSLSKLYHNNIIEEIGHNLHYRKNYYQLKTSHEDLNQILEIKESEEEMASQIFSRIAKLEPVAIEGVKGIVEPMGTFSGDSIYSALTPDDQCYILFADFSGHGLSAALGSLPISSIFYAMTEKGFSPDEILKEINLKLRQQLSASQFCCACFFSLNPERTTVDIWNAGIPDVLVVKEQGQSVLRVSSSHIPLGIEAGKVARFRSESVSLSEGDVIFTYSDGVTETRSLDNDFFGKKRLEDYVITHYKDTDLLEIIRSKIDQHSIGVAQEDDISMLEIRC